MYATTVSSQNSYATLLQDGTLNIPRTFKDETQLPSPEASMMNRYIDHPVSYNTGVVSPSVSLYEMETGSYKLPMTLNYHASGIKADDENVYVGLGWTMSAGGYISRTVHGRPDELRDFELRSSNSFTLGSTDDLAYLKDLLHRRVDANYDRYNYSFAGYSGSFILTRKWNTLTVTQLPATDLKIELIGETVDGVRDFLITTPSGDQYYFTEREHISYHYSPIVLEANPGYLLADYQAVCGWYLSKIVTASREDTIRFTYDHFSLSRVKAEQKTLYRYFSCVVNQFTQGSGGPFIPSHHVSTYPDKCFLKRIDCRSCRAEFSNSASALPCYVRLDSVRIYSSENRQVRNIAFTYTGVTDKALLNTLSIKSDQELIDSRQFTYYSSVSSTHKDLFGYRNYNPNQSGWDESNHSVLDRNGNLGVARRHYFNSAVGHSLKTITDAKGSVTTFEYESSECDSFQYTVGIGLRIKNITVRDPKTGRYKNRHFTYEHPASTINFDYLSSSSFISLGGMIKMHSLWKTEYTTGASFTSSCRVPGAAVEDAVIYYGKVTEDVTGTGIDNPIRTVYEFDISDIEHPYVSNTPGFLPNITFSSTNERYLGTKAYCLYSQPVEVYSRIWGPQFIYGHFRETCWEKAPMTHKTVYRHTNNGYEPILEEINNYSIDKEDPIDVGFFVECITRRVDQSISGAAYDKEIIDGLSDLNFLSTSLVSGRLYKDSTVIIKHFPDGNTQEANVKYRYNGHGILETEGGPFPYHLDNLGGYTLLGGNHIIMPDTLPIITPIIHTNHVEGFEGNDSLKSSDLHLLQSVKVSSGGHTFNRYYCYSSNVRSNYYNNICYKGHRNLPVMEKIVTDGTDTLLTHNTYAFFGNTDNLQMAERRLIHKGACVATQRFLDYDLRGNLLATQINGGMTTSYRWGYNDALPVASLVGGHCSPTIPLPSLAASDSLLVTTYDYEPLVGCTSITAPNTRNTSYEYTGNWLSAVRNNSGQTVESYLFSLRAANGTDNLTGKKVYTQAGGNSFLETRTFHDGLGYPVNTVLSGIASGGKELVSLTTYDALNRRTAEWLSCPVQSVTGLMKENQIASPAASFYQDSHPKESYVYEQSARENPTEILPAGASFASHPVQQQELCSSTSTPLLKCKRFRLVDGYSFTGDGYYGNGELSVAKTTDSDGRTTYVFTDYRDNKILERSVLDGSTTADTYYLYDALGNLCFVLPPALKGMEECGNGPWNIHSCEPLKSYAYFYRYNRKLQCTEKKLPGTEPVRYLYELTGNAVFSQDGNLRQDGKWHFAIPDRFGRPAIEGLCTSPDSLVTSQTWVHVGTPNYAALNGSICQTGYSANIQLQNASLLLANYYDGYGFLQTSAFSSFTPANGSNAKGLLTGTITSVLPSGDRIYNARWYDSEDRIVREETTNILGGSDITTTTYSFTGKPLQVNTTHRAPSYNNSVITEYVLYTYDSADRLKTVQRSFSGNNYVTVVNNDYDDLGRLIRNRKNGKSALETSYSYNLKGWLTYTGSSVFTESLFYEQQHNGSQAQYAGNISAMDWKVIRPNATNNQLGYIFTYDKLNRLTSAGYKQNSSSTDIYDTQYTYDLMGNILSLQRNGLHDNNTYDVIDDLSYTYNGNQVIKIDDDAVDPVYNGCFNFKDGADEDIEYEYDQNGNLTMDLNREICSIAYNCLNLPQRIDYQDGSYVLYTYNAGGHKLRTDYYINPLPNMVPQVNGGTGMNRNANLQHTRVDYCGNLVYENDTLKQALFEGGYVTFNGSSPQYHFYVQDHLGNNRVVCNSSGTIEQVNHYYPFGGLMGESTNDEVQRYKYNGKELDRMHGLNWYDFHARQQDAALGMFTSMDPLCEKKPWLSPYVYCSNNPIRYIDPDGRDDYDLNKDGSLTLRKLEDGKDNIHYGGKYFSIEHGAFGKTTKEMINKIDFSKKTATFHNVKDGLEFMRFVSKCTEKEFSGVGISNNGSNKVKRLEVSPWKENGMVKKSDGREANQSRLTFTLTKGERAKYVIHTHPKVSGYPSSGSSIASQQDLTGRGNLPSGTKFYITTPSNNKLYEYTNSINGETQEIPYEKGLLY